MYDPATQQVKLLDFGIARDAEGSAEERLTRAGFFVGTLQYVAPETLSGELVGEQADVYSLATITYYLLTECLPFPGKSPRELFQQLLSQDPVPLNQAVRGLRFSPAVEAAVMNGLQRDLAKRSKSVDEFARGFCTAVREEGGQKGRFPGQPVPQGPTVTRLEELLLSRSVRHGDFVLASGQRSSYYIDCRLTTMSAEGMVLIGREGVRAIREAGWRATAVGGLTHGSRPGRVRHCRGKLRRRAGNGCVQRSGRSPSSTGPRG